MATPEAQADSVKHALNNGTASASTATTLQHLLDLAPTTAGPSKTASRTASTKTPAAKVTKAPRTTRAPPKRGSRNVQGFSIHEDRPTGLSAKARYALATEVINGCLKVLSEAAKASPSIHRRLSKGQSNATPRQTPQAQRALQIRSGNATPVKQSPEKPSGLTRRTSQCSTSSNAGSTIVPVAECAILGFSFLEIVDLKSLGVRELPKMQLETGMVTLCGKLIGLGLHTLALKELRAVKRRLDSMFNVTEKPKPSKTSRSATSKASDGDAFATLLDVGSDHQKCPEARPLIITYQIHVLQLLASLRKPAVIEEAMSCLGSDAPGSPTHVIYQHMEHSGDRTKAARQLESLSKIVLQLSPSVSAPADQIASDRAKSVSPVTAFRLQMLGLRIRIEASKTTGQKINQEKDLAEPASRCLNALLRRLPPGESTISLFEICSKTCEKLGLSADQLPKSSNASQNTFRVLSTLAERESQSDVAHTFARLALDHCDVSEQSQARCVATMARQVSTSMSTKSLDMTILQQDLDLLCQSLGDSLSGQSADYDVLLGELAHLLRKSQLHQREDSMKQLAAAVAGFASQYSRSFPTKNLELAQEIIRTALSRCGSNDKLLSWVSKDACQVLVRFGVLRTITEKAQMKPMTLAWTTNNSAISLGRLIKVLVLRAASADPQKCVGLLMNDESLDPPERSMLLEWQLKCLLDVAHKSKYKQSLQKLLPELLRQLSQIYQHTNHPLRRARVASLAYQTRESHPALLPPHLLSAFTNPDSIETDQLALDEGLRGYALDVQASVSLSKIFYDGRPTPEQLKPILTLWQSVLDKVETPADIELNINDPTVLVSQLTSLAEYLSMLAEHELCLVVSEMLYKIGSMQSDSGIHRSSLLRIARVHIALGNFDRVEEAMKRAKDARSPEEEHLLATLEYHLCRAEHQLSTGHLDECRSELLQACQTRQAIQPQHVHHWQGQTYRLHHGRSWLLHSQYMFAIGQSGEALRTAKRSVKVMNGVWASLERAAGITQAEKQKDGLEAHEPAVDAITDKVSKLNLKPGGESKSASRRPDQRGAHFWPVATVLCSALVHLSDLYVHHGIFNEANFSSESAVKISDAIGSQNLSSRMRYHRASLFATAGLMEEAALCLAQIPEDANQKPLTKIIGLRTKAFLCVKLAEFDEALDLLQQAERMLGRLCSKDTGMTTDQSKVDAPNKTVGAKGAKKAQTTTRTTKVLAKQTTTTAKSRVTSPKGKSTVTTVKSQSCEPGSGGMSEKIMAEVLLDKTILEIRLGRDSATGLEVLDDKKRSQLDPFKRRLAEHEATMKRVKTAIQSDFSFNSLPESTISYPALQVAGRKGDVQLVEGMRAASTSLKPIGKSTKSAKKERQGLGPKNTLEALLSAAEASLTFEDPDVKLLSTADVHMQYSRLANVSMIMSATLDETACSALSPSRGALNVDFPRVHATKQQGILTDLERESRTHLDQFSWPELQLLPVENQLSANDFQNQYVDTLPSSWTAISICLNDACDELYIAKYRRSQPSLTLRLPFSRQKTEDIDEDVFDFELAKAELKEIIELNNYTCHQPIDAAKKGSKTAWWNEREELDRRLQGLIINMENIWFGGFKGVFSIQGRDQDQLDRFRKTLDTALERHLPSRKGTKRGSERLALHDQILELFVGLGADIDQQADVDECLADLLYFVVDILQFNGERNAYDEVDFDSMAIEVLDAIRGYHDALDEEDASDRHTVLVLDRRLQAFPWENMQCLENSSVSRVDSMETLRDRIVAMRQQKGLATEPEYAVPRGSGSFILNPSSDLKSTEISLLPELTKLADARNSTWTSMVRKAPSEEDFTTALSTATSLLYFGHGAGSQYIRPRAIRKLEKCSEVVWLMGCSSGAVTEHDELEPFSVPMAYMQAGTSQENKSKCMSVIATLWDVTDKDIDRFSLAVGEEWGLWNAPQEATKLPVKTPKKRERVAVAVPCTPEKTVKTPKTPKVKKTPAAAIPRTPSRNGGKDQKAGKRSLVEAVVKSREACYLRYLNGAAPVVWGVPVWLGD